MRGVHPFMKIPLHRPEAMLNLFGLTTGLTAYMGIFKAGADRNGIRKRIENGIDLVEFFWSSHSRLAQLNGRCVDS